MKKYMWGTEKWCYISGKLNKYGQVVQKNKIQVVRLYLSVLK